MAGLKLHARIRKLMPFLVAMLLLIAAALTLFVRYPGNSKSFSVNLPRDFSVYLLASQRLAHGQSPYQASDPSPFKYSPGILAWISILPQDPAVAWMTFSTLNVLLLMLALGLGHRYRRWPPVLALGLGIAWGWKGILETLDYGQLELTIMSLAILAAIFLKRRWNFAAGFFAGILPGIKLPWGILILPLWAMAARSTPPGQPLKYGGWRALSSVSLGWFTACFLWLAAGPSLLLGPERTLKLSQAWLKVIQEQPASLFTSDLNQSIWISIQRWGGGVIVWSVCGLALGWILVGLARHTRRLAELTAVAWVAPWLAFGQLINPLAWRWGSAFWLVLPLSMSFRNPGRRPLFLVALVATLALWLIQLNPVARAMGAEHWTRFNAWGSITLFWSISLLAWRASLLPPSAPREIPRA